MMVIPVVREAISHPPLQYEQLRSAGPVTAVGLPGGQVVWAITGLAEVRTVLGHAKVSADPRKTGFPDPYQRGRPAGSQGAPVHLGEIDRPAHTIARRILAPEFTSTAISRFRPRIGRFVEVLITRMLMSGSSADLVSDFAVPIHIGVVCELLGIPTSVRPLIRTSAETIASDTARSEQKAIAYGTILDCLGEAISAKRLMRTDDMLGRLIERQRHRGGVPDLWLVQTAAMLLLAGFEATVSTIALGVLTLLQNPAQREEMTAQPSLHAAEEMVRFHSPGELSIARIATEDFEVGGIHVRTGSGLLPILSVANRDPAVFDRADSVDLSRRNLHRHVGFGYGTHSCLGRNLARAQIDIAYRALFSRIPGLQLAAPPGELRTMTGSPFFGLRSLPVTW